LDISLGSIAYDSRKLNPNLSPLFVALRGNQTDGHQYIPAVLKAGSVALLVEDLKGIAPEVPAVQVANTREALAQIAAKFFGFPSRDLTLMGVTGTNGKTTITYLMEHVLRQCQYRPGITGTINCRFEEFVQESVMTTPESLDYQKMVFEMKQRGATHIVSEISSHSLSMRRCDQVDFDVVLFTNLSRDHLDFHENMEKYFEAKKMLFTSCISYSKKEEKTAVINIDDDFGYRLTNEISTPLLTYSLENDTADFFAKQIQSSREGISATVRTPSGEVLLRTNLLGRYNLSNCLGVLAACTSLKLDQKVVLQALATFENVPGRMHAVTSADNPNDAKTILVDYAHTPDALENVLMALKPLTPQNGRLMCLFGCGGDRDPGKRPLMGSVATKLSDWLMVTSDNPRTEKPEAIIADIQKGIPKEFTCVQIEVDRRKAIEKAVRSMGPQDILLIAGKGHENYQIFGTKKVPFDDVQVARDFLRETA
jgi:UDP-N-acetylmuramoyl-L-alanyl-D-glutamate--2,6-diaminopimelate ligase